MVLTAIFVLEYRWTLERERNEELNFKVQSDF